MAIQYLLLHARVRVPDPASLIAARRDNLVALGIELDLRYFIFVALEQRSASTREYIIYPGQAICRGGR